MPTLGVSVIKQRMARPGQGRSGGYRTLIAFRRGDLAIFLYGFAKNEMDNIDDKQLATLRDIAATWFATDDSGLARAIANGVLEEVHG